MLKNPKLSASDTIEEANTLNKTLLLFRTNEYFEKMFDTVTLHAEQCELEPMENSQRIKKLPKRLQNTNTTAAKLIPKSVLKKYMFEIIDYLKNEIDKCFKQLGLKNLVKLESLLVDHNAMKSHEELTNHLNKMREDFDIVILHAQLVMLPSIAPKYSYV